METKNAIIESVSLTCADHGVLSMWLGLDYGGSGQGFGGYCLYTPTPYKRGKPLGPNFCGHFIWRVLEVVGVTSLDELVGKTIRVRSGHNKVHAIGHIVKDLWFDPEEEWDIVEKREQP